MTTIRPVTRVGERNNQLLNAYRVVRFWSLCNPAITAGQLGNFYRTDNEYKMSTCPQINAPLFYFDPSYFLITNSAERGLYSPIRLEVLTLG